MAKRDDHLQPIEVEVKGNNVNAALNQLRRMAGREGLTEKMKEQEFYEKPSTKRRRKKIEADRRRSTEREE